MDSAHSMHQSRHQVDMHQLYFVLLSYKVLILTEFRQEARTRALYVLFDCIVYKLSFIMAIIYSGYLNFNLNKIVEFLAF